MSKLEVARQVKVSRETIWRWKRQPAFVELVSFTISEERRSQRAQAAAVRTKAMEVVTAHLKQGDIKAAIAILRVLGPTDS